MGCASVVAATISLVRPSCSSCSRKKSGLDPTVYGRLCAWRSSQTLSRLAAALQIDSVLGPMTQTFFEPLTTHAKTVFLAGHDDSVDDE